MHQPQRALFALILCIGCGGAVPPATRPAAQPLALTYLGAAGYQLDSGAVTLLADPYFSRPPSLTQPLLPDAQAIATHLPARVDTIVVSHTHADHALDVPAIAIARGATVVGSLSTSRLASASGVPRDRIVTVKGGEDFAFEGYSLRAIPSLHSALDHKHTFGGALAEDVKVPLAFDDYAEGGTFAYLFRVAGREVLFLGTANFIESQLAGIRPDVAIVATGLRQEIHDYTCRLMRVLGYPKLVLANHFDDWRKPAQAAPVNEDVQAFVAEVHACSPATRVIVPTPFEPIAL